MPVPHEKDPSLERLAEGLAEGVFPNVYDWIYVINVGEDFRFTFETITPPIGAEGGFLDPEFVGHAPEQVLPQATATMLTTHFGTVLSRGEPARFDETYRVGGVPRSFHTILTPVRNKWGRIHRIAGISRDFTALRQAEAALRASEERLAFALEGTQQGLWDWDLASGRVYRSRRWFDLLGLGTDQAEDSLEAGLDRIHPEDRRTTEAALNAHLEGRTARFQAEYRLRTASGDWIWVFDAGKVVAWDAEGRPARVTGLCTDITERRRAEESLRALVGGVVHEMRNPVYGITINLDALEATFGDEARYRPFVQALRESSERIASLMSDLRDYGEPRTFNPEPTRVQSLLQDVVRACEPLALERRIQVQVALEDAEVVIPVHARRMHQVFRNLIENALHHAPPQSVVVVRGQLAQADRHAWWVGSVEDAGAGFQPEALARGFEPFFTLRQGGTGLGLSIVKRVVEEHGGTVELSNRAEGGARVTVRLPVPRQQIAFPEVNHG